MIWADLTRRQQLWILRWQADAVRDLLDGPAGARIGELHHSVVSHLAARLLSTSPLPLEAAAEIEDVAGLPRGSLRSYGLVPEHEDLPEPQEEGLLVVEDEPVDTGPNLPAARMLAMLERADSDGIVRESLIRAANLDPRMVEEVEEGVRTLVPAGVLERTARALRIDGIAVLPDVASPYLLLEDAAGGMRFSLRARMTRRRAEAIGGVVRSRGPVDIRPNEGPATEPVAIRLDVVVAKSDVGPLVEAMFSR